MNFSGKTKYFVIGGRGYVGAELFSRIPHGVVALRTTSVNSNGFLCLRLGVPRDIDQLPIFSGDIFFLTAAISAPEICSREYERAWLVNVEQTSNLINSTTDRGAKVIFFSSDAVYGERRNSFDEKAACSPVWGYSEMKDEVEQRFAGNPLFKSIRISYVFSREDKFSRYLTGCAERNEEAELFHPFYRAIIHRNDVVEGALALAYRWDEVPEQVINFGGPQLLSRIDFAETLRDAFLTDLRFKVSEPPEEFFESRPRVIAMNSPILAKLLGRQPLTLREAARLEFEPSSKA